MKCGGRRERVEVSCFGLLSPPSQQRRAIFRTFNVQNSRPPPPSRLAFIFICDSSSWISSDAPTRPRRLLTTQPKLSALQSPWEDQSRDGRESILSTRHLGFFFSGVDLGRLFDPFRLKHFLPPCPVPSNLSPLAVPTLRPGWPLICRLDP